MYTLPVFNLTINYWRHARVPPGAGVPDGEITGNLANGRRVTYFENLITSATDLGFIQWGIQQLLCPKGTDIRGVNSPSGSDWLEIPKNSGVYYTVRWVQFAGLGFANEHLLAWVNQTTPYIEPLPG